VLAASGDHSLFLAAMQKPPVRFGFLQPFSSYSANSAVHIPPFKSTPFCACPRTAALVIPLRL
jgi:hypothetical protein